MQDPFCHSSSVLVERRAEIAFDIMSDGIQQGGWARALDVPHVGFDMATLGPTLMRSIATPP